MNSCTFLNNGFVRINNDLLVSIDYIKYLELHKNPKTSVLTIRLTSEEYVMISGKYDDLVKIMDEITEHFNKEKE